MGLFDFFKKPGNGNTDAATDKSGHKYAEASSIAEDERQYYQPDSYYTLSSYPGSLMEKRVIPFEERKETTFPSSNGLYVAEILLLEYCSYGKYPKPTAGYPGFWWFEYGIRDVGHALESLYQRGFLRWAPKSNFIKTLTVEELKQILQEAGLPLTGKKAVLIDRVYNDVPESQWNIPSYSQKYELTELGQEELNRNGYVGYMHKHPHKTTEDDRFGPTFTVWDINRLFPNGDALNWREVVGKIEEERFGVNIANTATEQENLSNLDVKVSAEEIREYLQSKKNYISNAIKTSGDGYDEEALGLDYIRVGKDKEALVQFYISIGKKFDAPALYRESAKLLQKYGMYEEAMAVLNAGLSNVSENNRHREEFEKIKQRLIKKMN